MFTGIIESLGIIESVARSTYERRFVIRPGFAMSGLKDGASICVNGVCLSVEQQGAGIFTTYASRETLERTNLATLTPGMRVNLEQALALGQRLDGHIVTGHIDCVATLLSIDIVGESRKLRLEFPSAYAPYVIPKGSVALNGISLTINDCGEQFLEVNIIPDSHIRTNVPDWEPGSAINMETDIIGKYIRHQIQPWQGCASLQPDMRFLAEHGFL